MHVNGVVVASSQREVRHRLAAVCLTVAVVVAGAFGSSLAAATPVRAGDAAPLKAVFIVGPAGPQTAADLADAEALAVIAESFGMDVRRVFFPHATWEAVMANIQGANLVYYAGHGYGWPSPYTKKLTEERQNGVGLNTFDGSGKNQYTYYGADVIRANWALAANAIVFLNHDCYTAGNGEPGAAIPTWDVARQRVDNFAAGFLAVGASAVFAYSYQQFNKTLKSLFTTDMTVEQLFQITGSKPKPSFGWVGWDPRKFDSVRTPGAKNFLDPHDKEGFLRAVTGNLNLTGAEWAMGAASAGPPPNISQFTANAAGGVSFVPGETPFFTPNGDGVTDSLALSFVVDREAFVDVLIKNESGNTINTLTAWSPGGSGSATWDGRNGNGNYVADGSYTLKATPRNRAGEAGNSKSAEVAVMTAMKSPGASPGMLYAADGDGYAQTTTLSVTLQTSATFWWKIANANGNVVRTFVNGVTTAAGKQTQVWDGKNGNGEYVPEGTYYSVTTVQGAGGTYYHSVPVEVRPFKLWTEVAKAPFVRSKTKVKFFILAAEPMKSKVKIQLFLPGLKMKKFKAKKAPKVGGFKIPIKFKPKAQAGTVKIVVFGTDAGGQVQQTTYEFPLQ